MNPRTLAPLFALLLVPVASGTTISSYDLTQSADRALWNDTTWVTPTANYSSTASGLGISDNAVQNSSWYEITPSSLGGATSIELTAVWQRNAVTTGNAAIIINWQVSDGMGGFTYLGTSYFEQTATETLDTLDQIVDVPTFGGVTPTYAQLAFSVLAPPNTGSSFVLQSAGIASSAVTAAADQAAKMAARTWPTPTGTRNFFNEADWGSTAPLGKVYLQSDNQTLQVVIDNPRQQHDQFTLNDDDVSVAAADHFQLTYTVNAAATGLACTINLNDSQYYIWSATLSGSDMTVGTHTVSIPLSNFTVTNSSVGWVLPAPLPAGTGILSTSMVWDSSAGWSSVNISQAEFLNGAQSILVFDPTGGTYSQDKYGLATTPFPTRAQPTNLDTTHRVYFAEDGSFLNDSGWQSSILAFASANFPGAFGVDYATQLYPGETGSTAAYEAAGVRPIYEGHMTDVFARRVTVNYPEGLTRNDGFTINNTATPWSTADQSNLTAMLNLTVRTTAIDAFNLAEAKMNAVFRAGFDEFLLTDYIWPYMGGDWGYGTSELAAYRNALNGLPIAGYTTPANRTGNPMIWNPATGTFQAMSFWQYVALFTDHAYTPAQLGLSSWNSYTPVTKSVAQTGTYAQQLNYFLYDCLWHYQYLHFASELGTYAHAVSRTFQASVNSEDPSDGTDMSLLPRVQYVNKVGYEFFGNPLYNQAWYRVFPWYASKVAGSGQAISMVGEIASGGWGPSRYDAATAYAHYYAATMSARPSDYNNQYMDHNNWADPAQRDARYAHWMAGALAFTEGWKELPATVPAQPPVVLVASRGVIEFQSDFTNDFNQLYNAAPFLDAMHLPFVECGRDDLANYALAATTQVLVYCPAESNARDWTALQTWLSTGSGKTLITHSGVPFSLNDGTHRFGQSPSNTTTNAAFPTINPSYSGLVQTITVGSNQLLYLPADTSAAWAAAFALLPAVTPEVTAPSSLTVQSYAVPGGRSYVAWDIATLNSQATWDYYSQTSITPVSLGFPSPNPAHDVQVYDFYANTVTTVTAGNPISAILANSSGLYYIGDATSSDWATTLANIQAVRASYTPLLSY